MKILFLCIDMHNGFHGSLLHVLEYGAYFKSLGYEVHIGSVFISDANAKIAEDAGFKVHLVDKVPLDETWDIVYALHMFLFPALLSRGLKYNKAISATLSAFGGIELVPPAQLWPYFDLITAISEESVAAYRHRFKIRDIFTIIPNHIPLQFMDYPVKQEWRKNIDKVAVVSNRYVPELYAFSKVAPFEVQLIGSLYNNTQKITPEFLMEYDAVISIGKTVQYCLGLGIPIFQYDRFGGCGYISPENILKEEKTNFSGRGTRQVLSPTEIIKNIEDGYGKACGGALALSRLARERYDIRKLVNQQLELIGREDKKRFPLTRDALLFAEGSNSMLQYLFSTLALAARKLD